MDQTYAIDPPADAGVCPFVRAVGMVQETWTFLILREAVTTGASTVKEFERIPGLTPGILAARLEGLINAGVFASTPDVGLLRSYELTEAGMQLVVILRALGDWADRFAPGTQPSSKTI